MKSINLFEGLTEREIKKICSDKECRKTSYSEGDIIFSKEKFERAIGIILEGRASVYTPDGSVMIRRLKKHDCFGIATLFNDENRYISKIVAIDYCKVFFIPERVVIDFVEEYPRFAINCIALQSKKTRYLNILIDIYSSSSVTMKLSKYLLEGEANAGFLQEFSPTRLSNILSIGRASLYRALEEFENTGAIKTEGKKIIVSDMEILKKFANGSMKGDNHEEETNNS